MQEAATFWPEVDMLSTVRQCNIVSLIGYCNQGDEIILVYEYIHNGSLNDHLHQLGTPLSWLQRLNICIDTDESWTAKIADLGLATIVPRNQTYVLDTIKGTFGYLDPDYFYTGKLTRKRDV
ncbi:receptor-like protein kinase FERONIA, partial [Tanacetum coccineum]